MRAKNKDILKEIKVNFKRFISLFLMAFLGVGFFVGIRYSSPAMLKSADTYYDEQNMYDIEIVSTLGLTNEDYEALKNIDNIDEVEMVYQTDTTINSESNIYTIKLITLGDIAKPYLLSGRLPNKGEIIVEEQYLKQNNLQIGDKLEINNKVIQNDDGEDVNFFETSSFEIVGTMLSPIYLDFDKGSSSYGTGTLNYVGYINEDDIANKEIATNIYIKVKDTTDLKTNSKKYNEKIDEIVDKINNIKNIQEQKRYESLKQVLENKVIDGQKELDEKIEDANIKIEDAKNQIDSSQIQLDNAQLTLNNSREEFNQKISDAQTQLDIGYSKLNIAQNELDENKKLGIKQKEQLQEQFLSLQNQQKELEENLTSLNLSSQNIVLLQTNLDNLIVMIDDENFSLELLPQEQLNGILELICQLNEFLQSCNLDIVLDPNNFTKEELNIVKTIIDETKTKQDTAKIELEQGITQINQAKEKINEAMNLIDAKLEDAQNQIDTNKNILNKSQEELNTQKKITLNELNNAQDEIDQNRIKLDDAKYELAQNEKTLENEVNDAKEKLATAKEKISEIKEPKWYVLDRSDNASYSSIMQDVDSVYSLSYVFPLLFFAIAVLIALNSMTRMVEEQRTTIGTYKALGYSHFQIASKYLIFASLATVLGGIFGTIVGINVIPPIIWKMYKIMYNIPNFVLDYDIGIVLLGITILIVCIVGATALSIASELKEVPANLMRPKPPKSGKRVFLEKITPIWKNLSFNSKVTTRNMFRYKKRFLMTIIGISGCTSLIVTGFGIYDSISSLITNQYGNIFNYDMQIVLKENLSSEQIDETKNDILKNEYINYVFETYITSGTIVNNDQKQDIKLIVVDDTKNLENIIRLKDEKTNEQIILDDETIVITEKAAQLLNLKQNDILTLKIDDEEKQIKVKQIAHNYIEHYGYISSTLYNKLFENYMPNVIYAKEIEDVSLDTKEKQQEISKELLELPYISTVNLNKTILDNLDKTLSSLNTVVYVLIISAALLAFVVLYNLQSVNISERRREIATIKVLGFYDGDVYNYINQETIILTIIGIILGLVLGYYLSAFVLTTCEINALRFMKVVTLKSYIISAFLTIVFTIIVDILTFFSLKKIDMIESLKSVE